MALFIGTSANQSIRDEPEFSNVTRNSVQLKSPLCDGLMSPVSFARRETWGISTDTVAEAEEQIAAEEEEATNPPGPVVDRLLSNLSVMERVHALLDPQGVLQDLYSERHWVISYCLFSITFLLIVLSVVVFVLESLPSYYGKDQPVFFILECICISWFTIEFAARLIATTDRRGFFKDYLNWIDIISIVPFYIDLLVRFASGGSGTGRGFVVLRVVRLTRTFRVFKLSKYNDEVQIVGLALLQSSNALSLLMFLLVISIVLFGSAVFFAEQTAATFDATSQKWLRKPAYGGPEEEHPFQSIPHAFWWCLVTVTTVGYGDMYPVSGPGYCVGALAMLTGLLIVAFPIIILSSKFQEARDAHFMRKEEKRLERIKTVTALRVSMGCSLPCAQRSSRPSTQAADAAEMRITMLERNVEGVQLSLKNVEALLREVLQNQQQMLQRRAGNPLVPRRLKPTNSDEKLAERDSSGTLHKVSNSNSGRIIEGDEGPPSPMQSTHSRTPVKEEENLEIYTNTSFNINS